MLAVDHFIKITGGQPKKVLLLHVIRRVDGALEELDKNVVEQIQKEHFDHAAREIEPIFAQACGKLRAAGIPAENISTKVVSGATTRAGTIIEEAREAGYGTIVVGRRGVSTVEDFDMGRVSNKLVQAAKDRALWVVG